MLNNEESGFTELKPVDLSRRKERSKSRSIVPRSIDKRLLGNLVKRKTLFTTLTHPSFTNGVINIPDGNKLTINLTITDVQNELWLMVPEWSLFIDAFADSNEYPNGSFFSSATNKQNSSKYDIVSNIKSSSSTDPVIKWSIVFRNNTGGTVPMGCLMSMRFITSYDIDPE